MGAHFSAVTSTRKLPTRINSNSNNEEKQRRQRKRAQAERLAFSPEEETLLKRLGTALTSLHIEALGGEQWVTCEDLKNLDAFAVPDPSKLRTSKTCRQLYIDDHAKNTVLKKQNKHLIQEVRRLRTVIVTLDLAINKLASGPTLDLINELKQRRVGTFPLSVEEAQMKLRRRRRYEARRKVALAAREGVVENKQVSFLGENVSSISFLNPSCEIDIQFENYLDAVIS